MGPHTIAIIFVRLAGLTALLVSLPTLGRYLGETITAFSLGYGWDYLSPTVDYGDEDTLNSIGWLALFALGLYLLFGGRLVIARVLRDVGVGCAACGYDLSDADHERCPECGAKNTLAD